MLKCDNPNIITSAEGFSVQVLGRIGLRYQQGLRHVHVDSEVLASPHGLVIYPSSIMKWAEPDGQVIGEDERQLIVNNIKRAFAFRNIEIEIL
jgi:hypothetical protein